MLVSGTFQIMAAFFFSLLSRLHPSADFMPSWYQANILANYRFRLLIFSSSPRCIENSCILRFPIRKHIRTHNQNRIISIENDIFDVKVFMHSISWYSKREIVVNQIKIMANFEMLSCLLPKCKVVQQEGEMEREIEWLENKLPPDGKWNEN